MTEILFLLGRPGSGKSRTARWVKEAAMEPEYRAAGPAIPRGQTVFHLTDYSFLRQMFLEDRHRPEAQRRFHSTCFGGFDVLDPGVLPLALQQVNASLARHLHAERTLILVEFARQSYNYQEVWRYFHSALLSRAFFLYLDADIETCLQRVHRRALYQAYADDQFVSPKIMHDYYGIATGEPTGLRHSFGDGHVATVENTGAWHKTWIEINRFLRTIPGDLCLPGGRLPSLC